MHRWRRIVAVALVSALAVTAGWAYLDLRRDRDEMAAQLDSVGGDLSDILTTILKTTEDGDAALSTRLDDVEIETDSSSRVPSASSIDERLDRLEAALADLNYSPSAAEAAVPGTDGQTLDRRLDALCAELRSADLSTFC